MEIMTVRNAPLYNAGNLRDGDDSGLKVMLEGREGSLDNYRMFHSVNGEGGWEAPRHRHNFEQIRFPLTGGFEYATDKILPAGWVGYFPEGVHYGPQVRHKGLTMVVLQFGGMSRSGYLSTPQRRRGFNELKAKGTFSKGVFSWTDEDGRLHNKDAFEATWEHMMGRKLVYPKPRYDGLIMMNPAAFDWIDDARAPGVSHKLLGVFTERGVCVEFIRLAPGATLQPGIPGGTELMFMVSGAATHQGQPIANDTAFGCVPGETPAPLVATEVSELLRIALPTLDDAGQPGLRDMALTA